MFKRLTILLFFCLPSFIKAQAPLTCRGLDITVQAPSNTNCAGEQYVFNVSLCPTFRQSTFISPNNPNITYMGNSFTTPLNISSAGVHEFLNTQTKQISRVFVQTMTTQPIDSVQMSSPQIRKDTLHVCRYSQWLDLKFVIASQLGKDTMTTYNVYVYIDGKRLNTQYGTNGALPIPFDSVKNNSRIQFELLDSYWTSKNVCYDVLGKFAKTKEYVLHIIENESIETPTVSRPSICPGDTSFLKRKPEAGVVWKAGLMIYYNDSSLTYPALTPLTRQLTSKKERSNGCFALSSNVTVADANCGYSMIRGRVYEEVDNNYEYSASEPVYANVKVALREGTSILNPIWMYAFTDSKGVYTFKFDGPDVPKNYLASVADPDYTSSILGRTTQYQTNKNYQEADLDASKIRNSDLALQVSSGRSRPGFTIPFYLNCTNQGKIRNAGTVQLSLDPAYTFSSSSLTPLSKNGNTLTFKVDSLSSGESNQITVYAILNSTTALGTTLSNPSTLTTGKPDDKLSNNTFVLSQVVGGSFDPNDIEVSPKGKGNLGLIADTVGLEYTIRFQNMGTDTAFTVVVKSKLPQGVDFDKFSMKAASHRYQLSFEGSDTVVWTFPNILLPDNKVNEPASHGLIRYFIAQKPKNAPGTQILNKAAIYFDFNAPVITNEVLNTVDLPTDLAYENMFSQTLRLFPNPTDGMLTVSSPFVGKLTISNNMGEMLLQLPVQENAKLDLSSWNKGLYLFTFESAEGNKAGKFILK